MVTTFADEFRKYSVDKLAKDKDYQIWFNKNECKFWDKNGKFGYFHFFNDGLDLKYQIMREIDDFIYVPINEETYNGETIKELIDKVNKSLGNDKK